MKKDRYIIAAPVKGGYSYYAIRDTLTDAHLVEISADAPNAKLIAGAIADGWNELVRVEGRKP